MEEKEDTFIGIMIVSVGHLVYIGTKSSGRMKPSDTKEKKKALQMVKGQERLVVFEGAPLKSNHIADYGRCPGMEQNVVMEFEEKYDLQAKQQAEI